MRFLVLLFLFLASCSVYRSQSRRDFETVVPQRVPVLAVFHCRDSQSSQPTRHTIQLSQLKQNYPDLIIKENVTNQTVVLLASRAGSSTVCVSESLDLAEYLKNSEF